MYLLSNLKLLNRIHHTLIKNTKCGADISNLFKIKASCFHTSATSFFHEPDRVYEDKTPFLEHFRNGLSLMKNEIKIFKNEVIDFIEMDPSMIVPGSIDKVWTFENLDKLNQWVTTSDSDHNNGYSSCELIINEFGKGVFQGILNNEVPSDGKLVKTGYCNMRSVRPKKSFQRDTFFDWSPYTHLVFRVRGDGRSFMLNLATPGYYDIMWNDVFQYVLHTRGGPYWQTTKIPFSKFILSSKGKIQDTQYPVPLYNITNLGLTIADKTNGPFKLEIDYVGLEYDPDHTEEFAYEMYKLPKNLANSF